MDLHPFLWCEVASTVIYLNNFIPITRNPFLTPSKLWHNTKPDISHLHPFECTAYAKIPVKAGGGLSKLKPQSMKCILIRYFGCDSYRLYDTESQRIFQSQDVIFEEGTGHKTLPVPGPSGEGETDVTLPAEPVTNEEPTNKDPEDQPVPTDNPMTIPPAPALCHSTCNQILTQAILDSQASECAIEDARKPRKDWAMDETTSTGINSIKVLHTTTNTPLPSEFPDPKNYWLLNSYNDTMTCPDIWDGPIARELAMMKEHGVWKVVDPPPDVCLIKTQWTFVNKYDRDGNLIACKACLVAKGFSQIPGIDFFETYASVVQYESLRMNLAIAAATDMETWQLDYIAVYLNSHPQATPHAELPDRVKVLWKIALLLKTLYRMMDGAYNWTEALDEEMAEQIGRASCRERVCLAV